MLKPCPFCGGSVELIHRGPNYRVDCAKCQSSFEIPNSESKEETLELWNRRTATSYPVIVDTGDMLICNNIQPTYKGNEALIAHIIDCGCTPTIIDLSKEDGIV